MKKWSLTPEASHNPNVLTLFKSFTNNRSIKVFDLSVIRVGLSMICLKSKGSMILSLSFLKSGESLSSMLTLKSPVKMGFSYFEKI